jgi:hypothetical protein
VAGCSGDIRVSAFYVPLNAGAYGVLFLVSAVLAYVTSDRLRGIRKDITNYQLGFDGERMVGQELNQALSVGCRVYHDVLFDGYNIDHVIVAPPGSTPWKPRPGEKAAIKARTR